MAGGCNTLVRFLQHLRIQPNVVRESSCLYQQTRGRRYVPKVERLPWLVKKERTKYDENLTPENKAFIKDVIHTKYGPPSVVGGVTMYQSPLKIQPMARGSWFPGCRRTGVIARKLGVYPMWLNDGTRVLSTLLQVVDNHVIRYIPPEEFNPKISAVSNPKYRQNFGCLLVGAESTDPQVFTKEYCGLFKDSGVMPKRLLCRFLINPDAAIQPGTPLYASHFKVGDYIDIRGKTVDRGFQGVVVRWGFKGGPASHGVTKTHRRPGNIGGGGEKGRVWPGKKMPGHMGNKWKVLKAQQILRINTKYNVIWVKGAAVFGETNSFVYLYDTKIRSRRLTEAPYFPTYYPEDVEALPDEMYCDEIHPFTAPSITYQEK